jgi:zinc and cadmium transporter
MTPFIQSILAVGAVSLVSLIGIATISLNEKLLRKMLFLLISLATGALLGDAFIHLLPEAFSEADPLLVSLLVITGILGFFLLEKFFRWHHSHGDEEFSPDHAAIHPVGGLVLVSDGVHNFIDGLAIGVAFMVSTEIGIATTIAIALHEIPQEIGDFGLLIHAGFSRLKALFFNFLSALTAFLGLGLAFYLGEANEALIPLIAAFAAGNFIYIALADLVPELQKTPGGKRSFLQFIVVLIGIGAMIALLALE